jgi:hypothetical protein
MKKLLPFCFLVFISSIASSQSFEALDHQSLDNITNFTFPYQEGLILIQSARYPDATLVNFLEKDGSITELEVFNKQSVGIATSNLKEDGSIDIYLTQIFEVDIILTTVHKINFDGQTLIVESFDLEYNSVFLIPFNLEVIDSDLIFKADDKLFKWDGEVSLLEDPFYYDSFYKALDGSLYFYNHVEIVKYENNQMTTVLGPMDRAFRLSQDLDSSFLLLASNYLENWTTNFDSINWSTLVGENLYPRKLMVNSKGIFLSIYENFEYSIYQIDQDSSRLYYKATNPNTEYREIYINQDSEFLLGDHDNGFYKNTLIYKRPLNTSFEEDFDSIDIAIEDLFLEKGPFVMDLGPYQTYEYTIELSVKNNSNDTILHFDLYSDELSSWFPWAYNLAFKIEEIILPGESKAITITDEFIEADQVNFFIPGANHLRDLNLEDNEIFVFARGSANQESAVTPVDVYPNPVSGKLFFQLQSENTFYEIYTLTGQKIKTGWLNSNTLDVENFTDGIYFIRLIANDKYYTAKFIKN